MHLNIKWNMGVIDQYQYTFLTQYLLVTLQYSNILKKGRHNPSDDLTEISVPPALPFVMENSGPCIFKSL